MAPASLSLNASPSFVTPSQAADEIVRLINASPRSPRPEEIEAIIARVQTCHDTSGSTGRSAQAAEYMRLHNWWTDPRIQEDEPEMERRLEVVCEARERILEQGTDLEAIAAVVLSFEGDPLDFDNLAPASCRCGVSDWEGRVLATAVLRQRSRQPLAQRPVAIPPAGQEHPTIARANEYRRLRAEEARLYAFSKEVEDGPEDEHERRVEAWLRFEREKILPVEREIWKNPTRTVEHVVLLAEIASYHENGLLYSLEEPDPHYHDDRSAAELVVGVLALAGKTPPLLGGEG